MNYDLTYGGFTSVALGNFDGVHLGHRAVLKAAAEKSAEGLSSYAVVFDEHPQKILADKAPPALCEGRIRERLFAECGVRLCVLDFNKIRGMSARDFFVEILVNKLKTAFVSCGYNYRFGLGGKGGVPLLRELCAEFGLGLCVAEEVKVGDLSVSSTNIRDALLRGDVELANTMLGREFSYDFTVVSGDRLGRLLGFPTINQYFPEDFTVPLYGVYASKAFVGRDWLPAVTNIGLRPTVSSLSGEAPRSETCILDFDGDLYGQNIEVALVKFLRPEKKFGSFEELSAQIKEDAAAAKEVAEAL